METTVSGKVYDVGALSPKQQFHVARRIMPVLASLAPDVAKLLPSLADTDKMDEAAIGKILLAFAGALSKMTNEDADYVIDTCMSVVRRKQDGGTAAPVYVRGAMMFDDVKLPEMSQLVMATIAENLGSFFPDADAPQSKTQAAQQ